jgi:S1-C subfamily serine protease
VTSHKPGDKVQVQVVRKGEKKTVTVTLGQQPANFQTG